MSGTESFIHADIAIIGGGLVGNALALALKNTAWRVALIEAREPPADLLNPANLDLNAPDMRSLALNWGSQQTLVDLNLWDALAPHATPIDRIHVSQKNHFGTSLLDAKKLGFETFGYVTPLPALFQQMEKAIQEMQKDNTHFKLYRPASVTDIHYDENNQRWKLIVNEKTMTTKIIIAADGEKSFVREWLKLPVEYKDYEQTAIATTVQISLPHENTAYERFLSHGESLAILPRPNHRAGLVMIAEHARAAELGAMPAEEFLAVAQKALGFRLGKLSALGKRQSYALKEIQAKTQALPSGLFLLGDAAHKQHPIAAQGFNLSLRDAITLAQLLQQQNPKKLNLIELTNAYQQQRTPDQKQTLKFTHALVRLFTPDILPLALARGLGLQLFDLLPFAQEIFCEKRMGVAS